jgi:lipocalin-like protein
MLRRRPCLAATIGFLPSALAMSGAVGSAAAKESDSGTTRGGEVVNDPARLVGTWELVSLTWTYPDGRSIEPWGKATGRISYDAAGNVMGMLMHERRNQADSRATDQGALSSYSAYFGTYRVDWTEGMIRHHVDASLNSDTASGELKRSFAFENGMLILGFTTMRDGVPVTRRVQWRRISG